MELLVAIALLALISTFGWVYGVSAFRGHLLHTERQISLALLQRARSGAMHNSFSGKVGVRVTGTQYELFSCQDLACATTTLITTAPRNSSVTLTWANPVIFDQVSGRTATQTLTFAIPARNLTINVNNEGLLD